MVEMFFSLYFHHLTFPVFDSLSLVPYAPRRRGGRVYFVAPITVSRVRKDAITDEK